MDILKIKKASVERITQANLPPIQVASLSSLIRASGVTVVAEGVEDDSQVDRLRDFGIDLAQGWLFSRPLSADRLMRYFSCHAGKEARSTGC